MKGTYHSFAVALALATGAVIASCSSALTDEPRQEVAQAVPEIVSSRYLSPAEAGEVAAGFMADLSSGSSSTRANSSRSVASVSLVGNLMKTRSSEGDTTFYVVNFKEGGYSVVAAERGIENPVFVYSETGKASYPLHPVMEDYLGKVAVEIPGMAKRVVAGTPLNGVARKPAYPDSLALVDGETIYCGIPCYYKCGSSSSSKAPLVKTEWSDGEPYNYYCPLNWMYHMSAGCVSVALGQIFGYHGYPTVFNGRTVNWDEMLSSAKKTSITDSGADDIAYMIHEIGVAINTKYSPGGSAANINDAIAYLHRLGYSGAKLVSFSTSECITNINRFGPLLMQGNESEDIYDPSGIGPGSHVWIVDGHNTTTYYTDYYRKDTWEFVGRVSGNGYTYLHFNMGEGGDGNANYLIGGVSPNENNFSEFEYNKKNFLITDITR